MPQDRSPHRTDTPDGEDRGGEAPRHPVAVSEPLDDRARTLVRELVDRAASHDRTPPLNEAAMLSLGDPQRGHALLVRDGRAVGYAQVAGVEVQLVVDPEHRGRGLGTTLAAAASELAARPVAELRWWAFGALPTARNWAERVHFRAARELLVMARSLRDLPTPAAPPDGVRLRTFRAGDADRFLAVNSRAFAHHPEQGALDAEGLASRMAEPWFRTEDLLLAERDGEVVGFHWTKVHEAAPPEFGRGEVYVLGVDPDHGGGGVGRALLDAGLAHLRDRGCDRVHLYVEASEERVVQLYRRAGFDVVHTDVVYAGAPPDEVG